MNSTTEINHEKLMELFGSFINDFPGSQIRLSLHQCAHRQQISFVKNLLIAAHSLQRNK